jgi:phosphoglycolate phosphatase
MVTRAVLLDLDGTLVDTAPDIAAAINTTLAALDCEPLELARVRSFIGEGIAVLVRRSLAARLDSGEVERKVPGALADFERHYFATNGRFSTVYPGVAEGLREMRTLGWRLGCVTNKPLRFAEPLLARFALLESIAVVIGGDSTPAKKPDPAPVLEACRRLGVAAAECVLIGDSKQDARAARAAGIPFVAVSYGYGAGEALGEAARIDALPEAATLLAGGYSGVQ